MAGSCSVAARKGSTIAVACTRVGGTKDTVAGAEMCMEIGCNQRTKSKSPQVDRLVQGCGTKFVRSVLP